jgi:hypothetical protein
VEEIFKPARAASIATFFFGRFHSAEFDECLAACSFRQCAALNEFGRALVDVEAQFFVESDLHFLSPH